jgi:hypothetical protein
MRKLTKRAMSVGIGLRLLSEPKEKFVPQHVLKNYKAVAALTMNFGCRMNFVN